MRIILGLCLWLFSFNCLAQPAKISGIRVWPSPENIRVVFDVDKEFKYKVYKLSKPERVVVDCTEVILKTAVKDINIKNTGIKKIRTGRHPKKMLRIVFELHNKVNPNSFSLKPNERYGHRLVLDLESDNKQEILALFDLDDVKMAQLKTDKVKLPVSKRQAKSFVIAIDPGHGGEDPGAIGPKGTKEKDIVLAIAKNLRAKINKEKNMQAILIRNGDYYIGLRERMKRARQKNADLFISIHADAFKNPKADGASVFILSHKGASSAAARWLAESENSADTLGGVRLDDKSDILASVLLDLSQTANDRASFAAAKHILQGISKYSHLHKPHVERAGFAVLKAPDMPSLLVESGFISNPNTEKKLRTSSYQNKIAGAILVGIKDYYRLTGSKLSQ